MIFPQKGVRFIAIKDVYKRQPNYKVRKLMQKDPSEWITVEDAHEPLISHSDFAAVQTMLARDRRACGDAENAGLFSGCLLYTSRCV